MASDLETLERRVRQQLNETKKLRFKRTTTTSAGAGAGTSIISTNLGELADHWNGATCVLLDGDAEGAERTVEDFTAGSGTLLFTNNAFPIQVASGTTFELHEKGSWSGRDLKQWLIDSINLLAGVLPKALLRSYLRPATLTTASDGTVSLADLPMIDIHFILINGKPAVELPPERISRITSGNDTFLSSSSTGRYFFYFRGKETNVAELVISPAVGTTVKIHHVPLMTAFETDGSTYFPNEFFDGVVLDTVATAWEQNENPALAKVWRDKRDIWLASRGVKVRALSRSEGTK